jgi:hypothetical protein
MPSLKNIPIPLLRNGPVTGEALNEWLDAYHRLILSRLDIRNDRSDFADGIVAESDGRVVLGADSGLTGRPSSSMPTLLLRMGDNGRATTQQILPQVSAGNVLSLQNVNPVTAEADASTAEITISSHTLQYGFGSVSYNGGALAGLIPETNYYVYADDPNYSGGAMTYYATTNRQMVTSNNGRYFVGAIQTAIAATVATITGATSANPIVFTTSGNHGWNTGNSVTFAGLPGDFGTNLNGNTYVITRIDPNEFSIAVNGSGYAAYTSGGTATRVTTATSGGTGGGGGWIDNFYFAP